jgi:hypothetical protein
MTSKVKLALSDTLELKDRETLRNKYYENVAKKISAEIIPPV